jgi:hypothetical protein
MMAGEANDKQDGEVDIFMIYNRLYQRLSAQTV